MRVVRGIAVSGGYGLGPAFHVSAHVPTVQERHIEPDQVRTEIQSFNRALQRAREDLKAIRQRGLRHLERRVLEIFDAQLLMLDDREMYHQVTQAIRNEHVSAEWGYHRQVQVALDVLAKSQDEYLRQMEGDIRAVSRRVVQYLQGLKHLTLAELTTPSVLLADRLTPADLVQLPRDKVLAIATRGGSRTDHTSLVARSLGIPAVVGAKDDLQPERRGQRVLVDAENGRVFFSPGRAELALYRAYTERVVESRRRAEEVVGQEARTSDGHRIHMHANLELLQEAEFAQSCGAEGIGLFRSEFLFISAARLPDEKTQTDAYTALAERFAPHTVTLRVYDLGGDKLFYSYRTEDEPNPAMGWRAVRLLLDRPALFRTQLRAMYKAAARVGNVQIMFPMVSSLDEWNRILAFARRVREELEHEGITPAKRVPLGVMVEIPSLALEADRVAPHCDFFSVGTNDLIQYLLAVDRQNPLVIERFDSFHPAVWRMLHNLAVTAHKHDIPISICGDLASDLRALPLLVGVGFDELSTVPSAIPQIKDVIGDFSREEAEALAREVLALDTGKEILSLVKKTWRRWGRRSRQKAVT